MLLSITIALSIFAYTAISFPVATAITIIIFIGIAFLINGIVYSMLWAIELQQ